MPETMTPETMTPETTTPETTTPIAGYKLSPQQRRALERGAEGACCAQVAVDLSGAVDRRRLERALAAVVARHDILRTVFRRQPGMKTPLQVIVEELAPAWRGDVLTPPAPLSMAGEGGGRNSCSPSPAMERGLGGEEQGYEPEHGPQLEHGPLVFATLLELADDHHVLVLRLPAVSCDARSLDVILGELVDAYGSCGFAEDEEPVPYLQFSEWQNALLEDEDEEEGRAFWRQRGSAGSVPRLVFEDADGAGEERQGFFAARSTLDAERLASLRALAGAQETSLEAVLLAAWQSLVGRLSDEDDFALAVTASGRKFEELEGVVGPLAKAVPLAWRHDPRAGFGDALRRASRLLQELDDWQEYFAWGEDETGESPVIFEHLPWRGVREAAGLRFRAAAPWALSEKARLKLLAAEGADMVELVLIGDGAVFEEAAATSLLDQLGALLEAATLEPRRPLGELSLLSAAERRRLVDDFNATAQELAKPALVHRRFALQVEARGDETALVFEDEELTYRELARRVETLARRLRGRGVGPEAPVAIHLERSAGWIVALLAVLEAGGAYVPLDATLPGERLKALLTASGARQAISDESLATRLGGDVELVLIDGEEEVAPELDPDGDAKPEHLAYVLFTSGSTGAPKPVLVEHRHLMSYVDGVAERLAMPAGTSYAVASTFAADLGHTAIFPALCGGGTLHVVAGERLLDAERFGELMSGRKIDVLKIVPSHLEGLLSAAQPASVLPRKVLVLGGEKASRRLIERLRELAPELRVINHYGPTETTVGVLAHELDPGERRLALGRPLARSRVYLTGPAGRLAARGELGELWIGGGGVARGYLGQPALTAERFRPDPFSGLACERLYRTGDLARFTADGALVFVGRADQQVKIHGFRVELGEIEAVLVGHPGVRQAAVCQLGERLRLVAFLVAEAGTEADAATLRAFAAERLPEAMMPASFVWLDALPLNANGKVDRRALAERAVDDAERASSRAQPRTLGEEMLAGLWCEVLGAEAIGVHDNFFAAGGDSLQAIQLISRIRKVFGVDLPVNQLFAEPTVARLAAALERTSRPVTGDLPPIERVPRDGDLPLSFAQERLWLMHQLEPHSSAYNTSGALRLDGALDVAALTRALEEIHRRHEVLRTTFPSRDGHGVQRIGPVPSVVLSQIDLSALEEADREAEAERQAVAETLRPFDLATGPLLRTVLLRLAPRQAIVTLTAHHIVSDGWSSGVLAREILTLYAAYGAGRPSPLPALAVQYADYAGWQRRVMSGETLERQLAYWREALRGAPELSTLPTDRPRPAEPTFRGASHRQVLPGEVAAAVRDLGRRQGTTLFMTLLAGFKALLARMSSSTDIVVGTDVANRSRVELEGLIGFFVNNLALRTDLAGNPTFRELLERVKKTTLGAFAHQELPFDLLVKDLQPKRSLAHTPIFQVLFVLQNTPQVAAGGEEELAASDGLRASRAPHAFERAKFDLALFVADSGRRMAVSWVYRSELFDAATIAGLAASFEHLLRSATERPDAPLSELELVSSQEQEALASEKSARRKARLGRLKRQAGKRRTGVLDGEGEPGS